jgi:YVTN family beta-propeller protein
MARSFLQRKNRKFRDFFILILSFGLSFGLFAPATPAFATFNPLGSNQVLLPGANNISNVLYDGTNLWAVSFGTNQVFRLNPGTGEVSSTPLTVGVRPEFALIVGDFLFVAATGDNTVTKINTKTNAVTATITLSGASNISNLIYDGTKIWAISFSTAEVYSFNPTSLDVSATVLPVGNNPVKSLIVGDFLFVAATGGNTVTKINTKTNAVVANIELPDASNISNLIYDGTKIWATSFWTAKVYSFNPTSLDVSATVLSVGNNPVKSLIVGDFLFVAATGGNTVTKINTKTNAVVANIELPDASNISNLIYDGKNLWAVSFGTGKIYQINPTDNNVSTTLLSVGSNPANAVQVDNNIWVAGTGDNSVTNFPIPIVTGTPTVATLGTEEVKLIAESLNSTMSLDIPAGSLPAGTVVTISPLTSDTGLRLPDTGVFHAGYNIVWRAPNQAPNDLPPESTVPLTLTVIDPAIRNGDSIFELLNGSLTSVGEATQNGKLTFKFSRDPIYALGRLTSVPVSEADINKAAAAQRDADVKAARTDISNKLAKSEKLTVDSFTQADIAGVTADNFAQVQAEILALPADSRTDINEVLKVARKYEVVGKIASENIRSLPNNAFVEVGLIPTASKNKASLVAAVRRVQPSDRDSYAEIQAIIATEAASIKARKDRLASVINRIKNRFKG